MSEILSRRTPYDDQDACVDRTEATLAIYYVDPEIVSQKLNLIPTVSQKIGVPRIMPSGVERIGRINSWLYSSSHVVSSKDIRRHLDWLLDRIEPSAIQLKELQALPGVKMSILCAWWSADGGGGPTLWPEQMERMAKLNLECDFSFAYYPKENDDKSKS
jgi:hypothetical protein